MQGDNREYVFDDDLIWSRSINELDIEAPALRNREAQPLSRPAGKPSGAFSNRTAAPAAKPGAAVPKRKDAPAAGHPFVYAGIITVCVLILAVILVMMMPQVMGYFWRDMGNYAFINGELLRYDPEVVGTYKQYREYMRQNTIYPGIFVDGAHVGGMTLEEARQALSGAAGTAGSPYSVTVSAGNKTWEINSANVPSTRDLGDVLEQAYAIGRTNTTFIVGTLQTPFRERALSAIALRENGLNLTTKTRFDEASLGRLVDEIAQYVTRPPVDAQVQSFDFAMRTFAFTDEQPGISIDRDELYGRIADSLNRREQGAHITAQLALWQPEVSKAVLAQRFTMISAFTTDTTNDSNRNNNINLACQAINGTVLMPGDTFSFNNVTGERTIGKGYREAGAISAGQTIDEVGGGICQVSSTLFNAVARADLEILSRSPHAWPSAYVNRGEDATVNWPNLDFRFRNNTPYPVFVIAYYRNRACSAEIWGMSLGDGITIDLKSEVIRTIEPSSEVDYVFNESLAPGTSKETIKARTGYVVDTYKVWYQNGREVKREKMHTSTYRAYQRRVEYH